MVDEMTLDMREIAVAYIEHSPHIPRYRDQAFREWHILTNLVLDEDRAQVKKWGLQEATMFEWLAYLTEEIGELSEAICDHQYQREDGTPEKVRAEAIQVATLALKIAEMIMHGKEKSGA